MNGKRVQAMSCAKTYSSITIKCDVGELSERPQGTRAPRTFTNMLLNILSLLCTPPISSVSPSRSSSSVVALELKMKISAKARGAQVHQEEEEEEEEALVARTLSLVLFLLNFRAHRLRTDFHLKRQCGKLCVIIVLLTPSSSSL